MTIGTPRLCIVLVNTRKVRSDWVKGKVFHALVNPRIPLSDRQESPFRIKFPSTGVLMGFSCPRYENSYKHSGMLKALWSRRFGRGLFRSVHIECTCSIPRCGTFFSWFSFSFLKCFWNAFCFNIIIQTFWLHIMEWGDTRVHVFIKHIMVTCVWYQWTKERYTNVYMYLCTVHVLFWNYKITLPG